MGVQPSEPLAQTLFLADGFTLAGDGSFGTTTGSCVRMCSLPAHRKVASVTHPTVRADLDQSFDIHRDRLAKIAFYTTLLVDYLLNRQRFTIGEILYLGPDLHLGRIQDSQRSIATDPENVGQADLDPFTWWQVHSRYACHDLFLHRRYVPTKIQRNHLTLALLMLGILTDNPYDTLAFDNFAFAAHSLD